MGFDVDMNDTQMFTVFPEKSPLFIGGFICFQDEFQRADSLGVTFDSKHSTETNLSNPDGAPASASTDGPRISPISNVRARESFW